MSEIHERIKKIINLAERAGTEEEAQTAMAMAQTLLAKHNLSIEQVIDSTTEKAEEIVLDDSTPAPMRNTDGPALIYQAIAKLYFCRAFMSRRFRTNDRVWCVIGKPSNIAIVHYVAQMLIRTSDKLAVAGARAAAQKLADDGVVLNVRAWAGSFRIGFGNRINERADEQIAKANAGLLTDETGTALALTSLYKNAQQAIIVYEAQNNIRVTRAKGTQPKSASGFHSGRAAADEANLQSNGVAKQGQRMLEARGQ